MTSLDAQLADITAVPLPLPLSALSSSAFAAPRGMAPPPPTSPSATSSAARRRQCASPHECALSFRSDGSAPASLPPARGAASPARTAAAPAAVPIAAPAIVIGPAPVQVTIQQLWITPYYRLMLLAMRRPSDFPRAEEFHVRAPQMAFSCPSHVHTGRLPVVLFCPALSHFPASYPPPCFPVVLYSACNAPSPPFPSRILVPHNSNTHRIPNSGFAPPHAWCTVA